VVDVARALLRYDDVMRLGDPEEKRVVMAADYAALRHLEGRIRVYDYLYRSRILRFRPIHPDQLTADIGELTNMLKAWDREIYDTLQQRGAELGAAMLLRNLFVAFREAAGDRPYAKEVVYDWIARVLQNFGLEIGTNLEIARRVKARLRSSHKRRNRIDILLDKFI
jgi:hypothetical protein